MASQHFFKPLLPGFYSHVTIPVAFLLKNVKGHEQKTAELRSEASKKTWEVKIHGQRITDGWKEFAVAHDLRIGDIVVFRQESDMAFHVTMLGPSCCEIQYVSCLNDHNNLGKIQRKKRVRKNPSREPESSSLDPSCFVANITASTLLYDRLNFPRSFVRENGLDTRCGEIVVLMNEKGRSWTVDLRGKRSCGIAYIKRGWRKFCQANELRAGSFFTFKLIQRGRTLVLRLSSKETEANEVESLSTEQESDEERSQDGISLQQNSQRKERKGTLIRKDSYSASQNRYVTLTLTSYNVKCSRLTLPIHFTKVSGIVKAKKMSFLDKHGVKWSTDLRFDKKHLRMRLVGGWIEFCDANHVKIGESVMLELIWEAHESSVLKFCSKVMPETN
ncbi:PREDICTED: putative B3 domain-containing protein REM15 [Camelina sativa]|uniref:B3 domain-containing protein REM15 n=1 Tax=Camelina sativa TaxID=90675 RepID=A0ABM0WKR5_CAMSA|nr:PREDICTED: putative B3 domain-containing protein REM15 [Camelina sativa]